MQKISSYLYPNRINVIASMDLFPVRWNIVYQNRIKIYKNVDNVLTIDVKNSDQKRIDITDMTLKMSITDINNSAVAVVDIIPSDKTGLATATVTADSITHVSPQFLNFTIYKENPDETKTIFYADVQFGAIGQMEIVSSALSEESPPRFISIFDTRTNDSINVIRATTYSEAVEITQNNFLKAAASDTVSFELLVKALAAEVTIQFTKNRVISIGTTWEDIETFTVEPSTTAVTKIYTFPTYNRELTWARLVYYRAENNTGKIDKVIVRL